MDGFQLIHEIKKLENDIAIFSTSRDPLLVKLFPKGFSQHNCFLILFIVVMSGTENLDIVYKCLKSGADHYILKPIKEEQLKNLWQTLYRKRQEIRVLTQLDTEKSKTSILEEKTQKLEREISKLKNQIDEAVRSLSYCLWCSLLQKKLILL